MKRFLKWLLRLFLIVVLLLGFGLWWITEEKPMIENKAQAEVLAEAVLSKLDFQAWEKQDWVAWSFIEMHHYEWMKKTGDVSVKWNDFEVNFNTKTQTGVAFKNKEKVKGNESKELVSKAKNYFNNDSFWLYAPLKLRETGVELGYVDLEGSDRGLLVQYNQGGSTPGDSYLWIIDESDKPRAVKIWAQVLPIGGLEFSWNSYTQLSKGAWIAKDHKIGPVNVAITNLRSN